MHKVKTGHGVALFSLFIISLVFRYSLDVASKQDGFAHIVVRIEKHSNIISGNTQFQNALSHGVNKNVKQHLDDNIKNHSTLLIDGFAVVDYDREIIAYAFKKEGVSYSKIKYEILKIKNIDYNYIKGEHVFFNEPICGQNLYLTTVVSQDELFDAYSISDLGYDVNNKLYIKKFNTIKIIRDNLEVYLLICLIYLIILLGAYASSRKVRREVALSHSGIKHELRGFIDSAYTSAKSMPRSINRRDFERTKYLGERIERNLSWAYSLTKQLGQTLDNIKVKPKRVALSELLKEFQGDASYTQNPELLDLKVNILCEGVVLTDKSILKAILISLLGNAVNHKDPRSKEVTISVEDYDKKNMKIEFKNNGSVSKKTLKNAFRFGYKDETSKGSGLGLYYVKKVLARLDGAVFMTAKNNEVKVSIIIPKDKRSV